MILFAHYTVWRMNQLLIYSSTAKVLELFGLVKDGVLGLVLSLWLDIVNLVVNPSLRHGSNNNRNLQCKMSIQISLTLECIWNFKNSIVHSDLHINLFLILKGLELRVGDHLALVEGDDRVSDNVLIWWKAQPPGCVKLNTDAIVKPNSASIVVVTRDAPSSVVKAWARCVDIDDSV